MEPGIRQGYASSSKKKQSSIRIRIGISALVPQTNHKGVVPLFSLNISLSTESPPTLMRAPQGDFSAPEGSRRSGENLHIRLASGTVWNGFFLNDSLIDPLGGGSRGGTMGTQYTLGGLGLGTCASAFFEFQNPHF